ACGGDGRGRAVGQGVARAGLVPRPRVGRERLGGRQVGRRVGEALGVHLVLVDPLAALGGAPPRLERLVENAPRGGEDAVRLARHGVRIYHRRDGQDQAWLVDVKGPSVVAQRPTGGSA